MSSESLAGVEVSPARPLAATHPLPGHPLIAWLVRAGHRLRRMDRNHPWVLDTSVMAAVFLVFGLPGLVHDGDGPHPSDEPGELAITFRHLPVAATLALQAALLLPLLWRRRAPFAAFAAIAVVFLLHWFLGAFLRADVALFVALYSVALHGRFRQLPWACAAAVGVLVLVAIRVSAAASVWEVLFFLLSTATAAIALGLTVRIRRAQLAGLRERAASLELERDQRSKLAAATERTRVAREMHDIIGHSLSVIVTLADAGAYAAETRPERGTEALRLVGDTGRQALGELRRLLGVLRERSDAPELSPQPRIADIEALCARVREAGPDVVYRSGGDLDALDRGVQLMAYRIVQEALTNTLKHADPSARAQVTLAVEGTRLRIRVHNTGPPDGAGQPGPAPEEGHGIAGMRERAALYGGTVTAGAAVDGGWTVQAVLDVTSLPGGAGGLA
ncbi:sensor histidine kinase [Pseudofrankia sp. BMG5.36]|uniref:sensor histidine kinase n=1 Tax=Pseudofrankia sp. BMG5.36 TaxID=1834512 RepID=UPI0008D915CD|nr:sensor histidine kinase [Pseudofrankia sp. BMG5.36]OHV47428.1 two-component sensor histidine kinase [Pseudofrankia sp. BMG5.36]